MRSDEYIYVQIVRSDEYIYIQKVRSVDIYNNKKVRSVKKTHQISAYINRFGRVAAWKGISIHPA